MDHTKRYDKVEPLAVENVKFGGRMDFEEIKRVESKGGGLERWSGFALSVYASPPSG